MQERRWREIERFFCFAQMGSGQDPSLRPSPPTFSLTRRACVYLGSWSDRSAESEVSFGQRLQLTPHEKDDMKDNRG